MSENKMREIVIEKVVMNVGLGKETDRVDQAYVMAERLTGHKPVKTKSTRKARTFKLGPGRPIGVKVTLRGADKVAFLKKVLPAVENRIKRKSFDDFGNFSFGIKENLEIPGEKYDPKVGILGMNICVALKRRGGKRILIRKLMSRSMPKKQYVSREDAIKFAEKELGIEVV